MRSKTAVLPLLVAGLVLLCSATRAQATPLVTVTVSNGSSSSFIAAAKNATKRAVVSNVASPLAESLDTVEDAAAAVGGAATAAQRSLDKKLVASGLPATAALSARAKNATIVPAKAKAASVVQALRNGTDAIVDGAWDKAAARLEGKEAVIAALGKNASARARATKRGIADAAFSSDKGKERLSVLVTLDVQYAPQGGDGFQGPQYSASSRSFPLLSQLKNSKKAAVESAKATLNGSFANAPAKAASAATVPATSAAISAAVPPSSRKAAAASPSVPVVANVPQGPFTAAIKPADLRGAGNKTTVSFSAEVVAGLPGNAFFSPEAVDPYDIANAVRGMLVSELRRLAAEGDASASALLALGDDSQDGLRTAAPLLSARGSALDGWAGAYLVSVSFPALLPGVPLPLPATALRSKLVQAVNGASPDDPCASLAERTGFDVCKAINGATDMAISESRLRAFEGALSKEQLLPFGRRSKLEAEALPSRLALAAAAGAAPPELDYVTKIFDSTAKLVDKTGSLGMFLEKAGPGLAILGAGWSLVSSIFGLSGGPTATEQTTLNYLSEINATTYKILDGVTQIENTLVFVEKELGAISSQIQDLSIQVGFSTCTNVITDAAQFIDILENRWNEYVKPTLDGPRFAVTAALQNIQAGKMPDRQPADAYEPWVKMVLAEPGAGGRDRSVEEALNNLHSRLVSSTGIINSCAPPFMNRWRKSVQDNPQLLYSFDDRQYFTSIQNLLRFYQLWAARGLQMIQEAYLFRAQGAALNAWAANQAVTGCNTTSPTVDRTKCIINAEQLPPDGPLLCVRLLAAEKRLPGKDFERALTTCKNLAFATDTIVNNTYVAQEQAGIAYSWGGRGEGVRLVLGTDVTGLNSSLDGAGYFANGVYYNTDFNQATKTTWLVPASAEGFFPTGCRSSSIPCTFLQGTLDSRSFDLLINYPLNYRADLWQPAASSVWNLGLRGMMGPDKVTGYPGTSKQALLQKMESGYPDGGAVPFSGMNARQWWIPGIAKTCLNAIFGAMPQIIPASSAAVNCTYGYVTTKSSADLRDRLPALDITQIPDRDGKCTASWDNKVPIRCGSDKTRFLVATLGARGLADTVSWPALDANNATATTARVVLYQDQNGELQLRCVPIWVHRDGMVTYRPALTSVMLTQTAGPVYASESTLAFASFTADYVDNFSAPSSFTNAFPVNYTSPTAFNRYLPRVITCVIRANDPANNGLPVYATGQYLAVRNSSLPYGIELRPNFVFPL